ncbi:DUF58 domain-containing protein [Okibacterium endophyticum]
MAIAVSLFVVAVVLDRREALYLALVVTLICIGALVWVRMQRSGLSARRVFTPRSAAVDEPVAVRTIVTSDTSIRPGLRWNEAVPAVFGDPPEGILTEGERSASRTVTLDYELVSASRGRFAVGPLWVGWTDPFGLVTTHHRVAGRTPLVITPRVTALPSGGFRSSNGDGGRISHYQLSNPRADELIAREYRAGDPLRRVHWRQTARKGELMVRQEEQQADPSALVVFDTSSDDVGFERRVELVASMAILLLDTGHSVVLAETAVGDSPADAGRRVRRFGVDDGEHLLEALADASPCAVPSDWDIAEEIAPLVDDVRQAAPVFVVRGPTTAAEARRLAVIGSGTGPAVIFLGESAESGHRDDASQRARHPADGRRDKTLAVQLLADAGWRTAELSDDTSVGDAWSQIIHTAEVVRGG